MTTVHNNRKRAVERIKMAKFHPVPMYETDESGRIIRFIGYKYVQY